MNGSLSARDFRRTVLYYPTVSIPNEDWLRQALLCFDQIASGRH
jgi:hypothetical protein